MMFIIFLKVARAELSLNILRIFLFLRAVREIEVYTSRFQGERGDRILQEVVMFRLPH